MIEIVLVTYANDLERADRCVASIQKHGVGGSNTPIRIVINDTDAVWTMARLKWPDIPVYHWREISPNGRWPSGWWSQQWLKMCASRIVETNWYLVVDSDMWLERTIALDELFSNDRALVDLRDRSYYEHKPRFGAFIDNAQQIAGVEHLDTVMRDVPPNLIRTSVALDLIAKVDPGVFGMCSHPTLEFFLYWAWVCKKKLVDEFYESRPGWLTLGNGFFTHEPDQVAS